LALEGNKPFRFKLIIFNLVKNHNVGTLMRTAYAFGCNEVIVVGRKRFKVTGASGTAMIQAQRHFFSMAEAVSYCRHEGFAIYGVEIGGENINSKRFDEDVAFVMGNEGRGLSDAASFCQRLVSIPQWGGVPSLNVSVAGGIVMHAFQSQQNIPTAKVAGQHYMDDFYTEVKSE